MFELTNLPKHSESSWKESLVVEILYVTRTCRIYNFKRCIPKRHSKRSIRVSWHYLERDKKQVVKSYQWLRRVRAWKLWSVKWRKIRFMSIHIMGSVCTRQEYWIDNWQIIIKQESHIMVRINHLTSDEISYY